jgi:enamine deaminase RidA (YjgF/YER057c/UK114 family)
VIWGQGPSVLVLGAGIAGLVAPGALVEIEVVAARTH